MTRPAAWPVLCSSLLLLPGLLAGQAPTPFVKEPAGEISGALVIAGGGKLPDAVRERFITLAGGAKARLVVVPTASATADGPNADRALEPWRAKGMASVVLLHTRSRDRANDPAFIKPLAEATGVWFGGGDQSKLTATYRGTAVERELHALLKRGGVIGGTSAGAAVMSKVMITGGNPEARTGTGFGFLEHLVVDQHFLQRGRKDRLVGVLARHPGLAGLGIDEGTAAVVRGRTLTVVGDAPVLTCLSASKDRPVHFETLKPGRSADLVALSRAALARTRPPFPPAKPPAPVVPRGTLIIGGGGGLPDEVWQRFIQAAGGPDAPIVVIPTAYGEPAPRDPGEAKRLRKAGAKNVRVLHAGRRADAEAPAFLAALRKAKGVWFTGGRQWRLVDAYAGTAAEREFHAVLERGGVIGGSSAGASIQADYLVRGNPLGNLDMSAEGYEQGFGFLKGTAIDQHFFKRGRPQDMSGLMTVYPQLLGLGIDEGTVLVVRGAVAEVVGRSKVAVYDRRRPVVPGAPDYEVLPAGSRYHLVRRERLGGS